MAEEEIIEEPAPRRPRRRLRWVLLALLILLLIAGLTVLWTMREQLAADYIEGELASRGVQASYEVRRITASGRAGSPITTFSRICDP